MKKNRKSRLLSVAVVGDEKEFIENLLPKYGLSLNRRNPDIVVSFGGDGTALRAEQLYPGIPRLLIRNSMICYQCNEHDFSTALAKLGKGKFRVKEELKIEMQFGKERATALNDINIHYIPPGALRFFVYANGKKIGLPPHTEQKRRAHVETGAFIGDGVVIATPHGSSGYFHAITRQKFPKGFAIAFNNTVIERMPLFLKDNDIVKIEIERGPGIITIDNQDRKYNVKEKDAITIKKSKEIARTIVLA